MSLSLALIQMTEGYRLWGNNDSSFVISGKRLTNNFLLPPCSFHVYRRAVPVAADARDLWQVADQPWQWVGAFPARRDTREVCVVCYCPLILFLTATFRITEKEHHRTTEFATLRKYSVRGNLKPLFTSCLTSLLLIAPITIVFLAQIAAYNSLGSSAKSTPSEAAVIALAGPHVVHGWGHEVCVPVCVVRSSR
mgnify:CR=1 FL=1